MVDLSCYDTVLGEEEPIMLGNGNGDVTVDGVVEELSSIRKEVRHLRMSIDQYLICAF